MSNQDARYANVDGDDDGGSVIYSPPLQQPSSRFTFQRRHAAYLALFFLALSLSAAVVAIVFALTANMLYAIFLGLAALFLISTACCLAWGYHAKGSQSGEHLITPGGGYVDVNHANETSSEEFDQQQTFQEVEVKATEHNTQQQSMQQDTGNVFGGGDNDDGQPGATVFQTEEETDINQKATGTISVENNSSSDDDDQSDDENQYDNTNEDDPINNTFG